MATALTTIPRMRKVYRDLYANLPVTGLRIGDLGYATDRKIFYSWTGAIWDDLTIYIGYGLAANIPAAADLPDGCLYQETDTTRLMEVQAGVWVCIFYSGSGLAANKPAAADVPEGALYYETDTTLLKQVQSGAWATIKPPDIIYTRERKTADQVVNNSNVLVNDTHLKWEMLANEVWEFEIKLDILAHADADFKAGMAVPAGAVIRGLVSMRNHAGGNNWTKLIASGNSGVHDGSGLTDGTHNEIVVVKGIIRNGGNVGNAQLQWAQGIAHASDATVKEGSCLIANLVS